MGKEHKRDKKHKKEKYKKHKREKSRKRDRSSSDSGSDSEEERRRLVAEKKVAKLAQLGTSGCTTVLGTPADRDTAPCV